MKVVPVALVGILVFTACTSARKEEDRFLAEVSQLGKEEILAKGDALAEKKKYMEARKYYSFLADSFPNDPVGRRAALKIADTFFASKDPESQAEAQVRYKDFATRYPNDPQRAYALLMLSRTYLQQARGPQRDLTPVREAAESLQQVISLFPDSAEAEEARKLLARCREDLANHELLVARYYAQVGATEGARNRLRYLLRQFPETEAAKAGQQLLQELEAKEQVRSVTSRT
ncbi:MAG: outer membrane protein assembly factor BamD [Thermoanaerobaculum sp.]|nr:outer membrane protein assembly factor BamD [Thermoanaerobaculum sp.]